MHVLQAIWSDGLVLMTVGSAVISALLAVACCIAGLCPCAKEAAVPSEPAEPAAAIDYTWMRAA